LHSLVEDLTGSIDLFLKALVIKAESIRGKLKRAYPSSEEHENVTRWLCEVDLHHCHVGCIEIVGFGLVRIEDLHREGSARNSEHRGALEVGRELL